MDNLESTLLSGKRRVKERSELSVEEFKESYMRKRIPVVVKGGLKWSALPGDMPTFSKLCEDVDLDSLTSGGGGGMPGPMTPEAQTNYDSLKTFGDYFEAVNKGLELPYLRNIAIGSVPALQEALPVPGYFTPNWLGNWPLRPLLGSLGLALGELFIAPSVGSSYGLTHFDRESYFLGSSQLFGEKFWWLSEPEKSEGLYPVAAGDGYPHHSAVDVFNPDLEKYPNFKNVKASCAIVEAGDCLFVPPRWWHNTIALTPNAGVVYRVINSHNIHSAVWGLRIYRKSPLAIARAIVRAITGGKAGL